MNPQELSNLIDRFLDNLKKELLNPNAAANPIGQRTIWDRVKNWWANVKHGRYNDQNPYLYKNKFGDYLGSQAQEHVSLREFRVLKEQVSKLDGLLTESTDNLQIMKIIDKWGKEFKTALLQMASNPQTTQPSPQQSQQPQPQASQYSIPEMPAFTNKKWNELSPFEQAAWNKRGGGTTTSNDISKSMKLFGINSLPWILRVGDPRIKELKGQKRENLIRQKRIEFAENPISDADFPQAVEIAKKNFDAFIDSKRQKNTFAAGVRKTRRLEPMTPSSVSTPEEPKPEPVVNNPVQPEVPTTPASIDNLPIEEPKKAKRGRPPKKKVEPIPNLFADDQSSSEEPKEDKFQRQARLQSAIEALEGVEDDDVIKTMKDMLSNGQLDELQQVVDLFKKDESLTLDQRKLFYRALLRSHFV